MTLTAARSNDVRNTIGADCSLSPATDGLLAILQEILGMNRDGWIGHTTGLLRIAAHLLFSQVALRQLVAAFHAAYPEVQIEVMSTDCLTNLAEEHVDVAIRINSARDGMLVDPCFARPAGACGCSFDADVIRAHE